MAHFRKRHVGEAYSKILAFSPLVGVFGHRQVGKTTFLESVVATYATLDDSESLESARLKSKIFLQSLGKKPAGIDECQFAPELFPALKEWVRIHKKPGQFVLSGSVRFFSRQAIRESLTGRIVNVDLLPMCLTELYEMDRCVLPLTLIKRQTFGSDLISELPKKLISQREKYLQSYLATGGLPGVCFLRNDRLRNERLRDQLLLILDRDLRLVYPSSVPYVQLLEFVRQLSRQEGEPFQPTQLRKSVGLAESTQKKLIQALESIFLIRLLPLEGDRRGLCVYFEDQAEHLFLQSEKMDSLRAFEGLVYRNLRATFAYEIGLDYQVFQYRQRPDIRIPFAIRTKEGCLGVLPILTEAPSRKDLRMAGKFLRKYSPASILIVTKGQKETKVLEPRILQVPAERLLFE